jgi:hypothetical protein
MTLSCEISGIKRATTDGILIGAAGRVVTATLAGGLGAGLGALAGCRGWGLSDLG